MYVYIYIYIYIYVYIYTYVYTYIYIYEDISIRGITEAEIYFEPRHQFESILLLKIL